MKFHNKETGETLSEYKVESLFIEMLDDTQPCYTIFGCSYYASQVLREVDPIHYRCQFLDWLDATGWEEADE